jgi:hypothetical protein
MLISADLLHSTDRLATGAGVFISHRLRRVLATFEVFGSVAAALVVALQAGRTRPLPPARPTGSRTRRPGDGRSGCTSGFPGRDGSPSERRL